MSKLFLVGLLLLTACGSIEEYNQTYCNEEGAYSLGMNDQNDSSPMDVTQFDTCPGESKKVAMSSYNKGYVEGRKMKQSEQPKTINLNVNTGAKKFYCTLDIFGKTYSAFGSTKPEANKNVVAKCKKDNNEMHCHSAKCNSIAE